MNKTNQNELKNLTEKIKIKNLTDEIEKKDIKIKENIKKLKQIKESSLKEFVYANQIIPESWKNKINYQNQVIEMFVKDTSFLSYVGNMGSENKEIINPNLKLAKKYKLKNYSRTLSCNSRNDTNNIKEENTLLTSKNYSSINIRNKMKNQKNKIIDDKELSNILELLQNDFPIKDKLKELFPEKLLKSINIKNKTINALKNKDKESNYPILKPDKRKNIFRQNIFVNLLSSKTKNKSKRVQSAYMKNGYKKENDFFVRKKFNIKDRNVMKHLESVNFFGPYYTYCPPCGNRNVDFYKNLDKKKLIQIVQQIKKFRGKAILGNLSDRANINKNKAQF